MKMYKVHNTFDYKSENKIVHEYTITVSMNDNGHEVITLSRSHNDLWHKDNRGEELMKIIDTGDMMIYPKKMYSGNVDYTQHAELFILLSFLNKAETFPLYKGYIEEITPQKNIEI